MTEILNHREDPRPEVYLYWNQLVDHLDGDTSKLFSGEFVWPKQWELHLSSNKLRSCQLNCEYCAGRLYDKSLGNWEIQCLELMDKVAGNIPQHIYGGAYTEPILSPYFMTFIAMTKKYNNYFGIHTNGVALKQLDDTQGFLTELHRLSDSDRDYLSVSLDAGTSWSWKKVKRTNDSSKFWEIIDALERACNIRAKGNKESHAIRLGFLISEHTATQEDFEIIVNIAKNIGLDSVRFSIPFASYNQSFDEVREYKESVEVPGGIKYEEMLKGLVSKSKDEKPYIFWNYPYFTDIDRFNFEHCFYGFFQITTAAFSGENNIMRCSTIASPTAKHLSLGGITTDLEEFKKQIKANQSLAFNCKKGCFDHGLRCNRMGLEINTEASKLLEQQGVIK
jgi:wyosine [tRNA(Phe)-imidazoG37] synthetase (radical SAM superfamily)